MFSYEELMNYCSNYRIEKGIVFDKNTNQQIKDEETILKIKSSILIYTESKELYQSDMKQFGKVWRSQEEYIRGTMEKFSVHNEESLFGVNKLIRAILNSNGHYVETCLEMILKTANFQL